MIWKNSIKPQMNTDSGTLVLWFFSWKTIMVSQNTRTLYELYILLLNICFSSPSVLWFVLSRDVSFKQFLVSWTVLVSLVNILSESWILRNIRSKNNFYEWDCENVIVVVVSFNYWILFKLIYSPERWKSKTLLHLSKWWKMIND